MPDRPPPVTLILASRSPRRARLLRDAGYRFTQADPPFEDPPQPQNDGHPQSASELALALAKQKALSLRGHVGPGCVILAADTICVGADGQLIGQPIDPNDARRMIRQFIKATHRVVTAVALLPVHTAQEYAQGPSTTFADQAQVALGTLDDTELDNYLNTDQWQGKAGGYNLFDRQQAGWPLRVQGDPTTVVGLPMQRLIPALARFNVLPLTAESSESTKP